MERTELEVKDRGEEEEKSNFNTLCIPGIFQVLYIHEGGAFLQKRKLRFREVELFVGLPTSLFIEALL